MKKICGRPIAHGLWLFLDTMSLRTIPWRLFAYCRSTLLKYHSCRHRTDWSRISKIWKTNNRNLPKPNDMPIKCKSQLMVQILDTLRFWAPFVGLGTTYNVHLGLIEKSVMDFLLVLIELLSLDVIAEALRAKIDQNWRFRFNAVSLTQNFR